jgi:hypothetical protein
MIVGEGDSITQEHCTSILHDAYMLIPIGSNIDEITWSPRVIEANV